MRFVYLHGFASSPRSKKAQFFHRCFAEIGLDLEIPTLDDQGFENLTVSGQLAVVERLLAGEPAVLMGSSMGGYLAALYAAQHPETHSVILMAPAFGFARNWGPVLERWKRDGSAEFFHYAENRPARVGYGLIEDALQYPDEPQFACPAMIFHGIRDEVVPAEASMRFCARNMNARLQLFDSGHELIDVMEEIWLICRQHHPELRTA